ncbi:FAD:protein FMN transferase [Aureliella helgolandensis]|uniref:FAD:protein FMN transferase n=1 Tax=Aureliella helgolandensis TaxID=2527968 RepID=UPI0018D1216A|nr:FAD:protein FMN transferase [Aureliella helgolandensis]
MNSWHSGRIATLALLAFVCLVAITACRRKTIAVVQMFNGRTMGTTYSVKLVPGPQMPDLAAISAEIASELERVNAQMSTYRDDSEISRFNNSHTTDWFPVSPETVATVELSLAVSAMTKGAFDITVGPLVSLWGFGPQGRAEHEPSEATLTAARQACGYRHVSVRQEPPAIKKALPEVQIDLSAIAKGHGVDRVAQVLDRAGVAAYFVEIGGEVRTRGTRLDGRDWQVGIERPSERERGIQTVVGLSGQGLATSGDYRNFYNLDNQRVSHTIDPRTGRPTQSQVVSTSVVASSCALADAAATSLMVLDSEEGWQLAEQQGWAVMMIVRNGDSMEVRASESFRKLEQARPASTP